MKKQIVLFLLASFASLLNAQNPASYYTGFDSAAETTGWTLYRKGAVSNYSWNITPFSGYSPASCLAHGYPVGGSSPTIEWYVSPPLTFAGGGQIDSLRFNFSGFGTPMISDTVAIYLLSGSADPASAAKLQLLDFRASDYNNDNVWRLKTNIPIPATAGTCYIAFMYRTTNNWLDVKFDNLKIKSNSTVGLARERTAADRIYAYPQPATDQISFRSDRNVPAELNLKLFTTLGQLVIDRTVTLNEPLNVSLEEAIYFYKLFNERDELVETGRILVKSD